jgi:hypothetical protein
MSLHFDSGFGVIEVVCDARQSVLRIELGMVELMAMRQIARVIGYAYELAEAVRHRSPIPSESLGSAAAPL